MVIACPFRSVSLRRYRGAPSGWSRLSGGMGALPAAGRADIPGDAAAASLRRIVAVAADHYLGPIGGPGRLSRAPSGRGLAALRRPVPRRARHRHERLRTAEPVTSSGPGRFSLMAAAETDSDRPDLEIRLLAADDSVAHTLELVGVRVSRGLDGPGVWLSGTDRAGVLEFRFLLGGPDRDRVRMTMASLVGKTPTDVLPAVHLVVGLASGAGLALAVRGGRPFTPIWHLEES